MVKGDAYDKSVDLGEAIAYSGIADYPARFKCATVSFEGVLKAIEDYEIKKQKNRFKAFMLVSIKLIYKRS